MSEFELITLRQRLVDGRHHKAQRAALFHGAPIGYVKVGREQIELDPDERVRAVVALIFAKFEEPGTLGALRRYLRENDVLVGVRPQAGAQRGRVQWRRANRSTLTRILHNPTYAGAYADGRTRSAGAAPGRRSVRHLGMAQWQVLHKDCLPAYISWEHYQENQDRLRGNRSVPGPGTPRHGAALLAGLVVCGRCGRVMRTGYSRRGRPCYRCRADQGQGGPRGCAGLTAAAVDAVVKEQVLRALEPAALELHLGAVEQIEKERERLDRHGQGRLEQLRDEAERVERQYQAVEPENRLVARTLERRWEEALRQVRRAEEEYDRFRHDQAARLSAGERELIEGLSRQVPALWEAESTTAAERKEIVRCLVERVVVSVSSGSEEAGIVIHWQGGVTSTHAAARPVQRTSDLRAGDKLLARVREPSGAGKTSREMAVILNGEGFVPPRRLGPFTAAGVRQLLKRAGLVRPWRQGDELGKHEWWLADLADELALAEAALRVWVRRGWVNGRQTPVQRLWVVWADREELRRLRAHSHVKGRRVPPELKIPKERR